MPSFALRRHVHPVVGLVLLAALLGWAQVSSHANGSSAESYSLLLVGCAGAYSAGRLLGRRWAWLVALGVVVGIGVAFAVNGGSLSGHPLAPPLHYGNADGALAALGAAACVLLATLIRHHMVRVLALCTGVAFAVVALLTRSQTGAIAAVAVMIVGGLALLASRWSFVLSLVLPVVVAAVALGSVLLAVAHHPHARTQTKVVHVAEGALSERRVALWHDAVVLTAHHPGVGVGPGRFAEASPVARSDKDTAWAHSGWLQQSAEQGVIGVVLLAGASVWAWVPFVAGARRRQDAGVAVAGSAALGVLLLCASVDYVLHFAALGFVCALLVGAATPRNDHAVSVGSGDPGLGR